MQPETGQDFKPIPDNEKQAEHFAFILNLIAFEKFPVLVSTIRELKPQALENFKRAIEEADSPESAMSAGGE